MISRSLANIQALILLIITGDTGSTSRNSLVKTNGCVCPGDRLSYECSVAGEGPGIGSTIWRGSALAIPCAQSGGELVLRHRSFNETRSCGNIIARGIKVEENSCYTSQLNITLDSSMENKTLECIYHNGFTMALIGSSSVEITKDPYPPPNDVIISELVLVDHLSLQVTFEWSAVVTNYCPTLSYIITSDCGLCPNITRSNNSAVAVTCTKVLIGQLCALSMSTSVCGSVTLVGSNISIAIMFDGLSACSVPASPTFNVVPRYSYVTRNLSAISISFNATETPNTHGLNLSTSLVYTVVYVDSVSGKTCGSSDIPVSMCNSTRVCRQTFNFSSSACPSPNNIIVHVFGTNIIGRGPSLNFTLGVRNIYVEVTFDANFTRATCKFLQWQPLKGSQCTCSILYGNKQSPIEASWSDTVVLNLATESLQPDEYHFIVTATYGTFSTLVEGTLIKQKSMATVTQSTISVLVFGISLGTMGVAVLLIAVLLSVIITVVLIRSKKKSKSLSDEQTSVSELPSSHIDTERNVAYEVINM